MPIANRLILSFIALLTVAAVYADDFRLRTDSAVDLTKAGIELRTIRDFQAKPLTLPRVYTYRSTQGEEVDAYDPAEIWAYDQTYATWVHAAGSVTVAMLDYPTDAKLRLLGGQHVLLDDFNAAMAEQPEWKLDQIRAWVTSYMGAPIAAEDEKAGNIRPRYPFRRFTFQGVPAEQLQAWCLLVDRDRRRDRATYAFIVFRFPQPDQLRNQDDVIERIVESVRWIGREARHADRQTARDTRDAEPDDDDDQSMDERNRAARSAEAKARVIRNIENLEDWWYLDLDAYILTSNMERRDDRLIDMIREDMPVMRRAYAHLIPPVAPITDVSVVRVFATRADYMNYIPQGYEWTGGIWMPDKKELVISPVEWERNRREARNQTMGIIYHEAFHQYLYYAFDRRPAPVWYNEGIAAFFEGADVDARRGALQIEEVENRVDRIEAALKTVEFKRLLRLDLPGFYDKRTVEANYNAAYALIYYLMKAHERDRKDEYDGLLALVRQTIADGGSAEAASAAVLQAYDIDALQWDVMDFWDDRSARRRAENNRLFR